MKVVRTTLAGLIGLLAWLPVANAQDEEDELAEEFALLKEEAVTFTAARHEQEIEDSPSAITIITREEIENTFCTSVTCLLRFTPELDVLKITPMYTAVNARALPGSWGDKIQVQVDGREINNDAFGIPFWENLPVHLEEIERIEIVRGPVSALYGANAYSAVVSIVTRPVTDSAAEAFLGGGEHDTSSLCLRLDRLLGDFRLQLSGSQETSGNFELRGRERELHRLRLRLSRENVSSTTALEVGFSLSDGLMFVGIVPGWLTNTYQAHFLASHQQGPLLARLSFALVDGDLHPDLPLSFDDTVLGQMPELFRFLSTTFDGEAQTTWEPLAGNLLVAGGNYRWITFISEDNNPERTHQHRLGAYLHDEQRLSDEVILTGGIRFDYNNITNSSFIPRLAGVWRFNPNHLLRLAFGMAFRKPSFFNTSFHIKGVQSTISGFAEFCERSIGNDKLENENITTFEAGYLGRFLHSRLKLEGELFFNQSRNVINFFALVEFNQFGLPDLQKSVMQHRNTGRDLDSLGGTLTLTYHIQETMRIAATYTYRYSFFASEPDGKSLVGEGAKGSHYTWEPGHLFSLTGHYLAPGGLWLGLGIHGASSWESAWSEDGSVFGRLVLLHNPAVLFASGFLAWRLESGAGRADVGVRADNIFNAGFFDMPSTTLPSGKRLGAERIGRTIFLFVRGSI